MAAERPVGVCLLRGTRRSRSVTECNERVAVCPHTPVFISSSSSLRHYRRAVSRAGNDFMTTTGVKRSRGGFARVILSAYGLATRLLGIVARKMIESDA